MDDETFTLVADTQSVKELKGMIRKPAKPVSIEEMNAAIKVAAFYLAFCQSFDLQSSWWGNWPVARAPLTGSRG